RHTSFSRDWSSDVCSSDLISPNQEVLLISVTGRQHGRRPVEIDAAVSAFKIRRQWFDKRLNARLGLVAVLSEILAQGIIEQHQQIGRASCRERREVSVLRA